MRIWGLGIIAALAPSTAALADGFDETIVRVDAAVGAALSDGDVVGASEALAPICEAPKGVSEKAQQRRITEVAGKAAAALARAGHHQRAFDARMCALSGFRPLRTNCHRPRIDKTMRAELAAVDALIGRWLEVAGRLRSDLRRLLGHRAGLVRHVGRRAERLAGERRCVKRYLRTGKLDSCGGDRWLARTYLAAGGCVGSGAGRTGRGSVSGSRRFLGLHAESLTGRTAKALARRADRFAKVWGDPAPVAVTARWLRGLEALGRGDRERALELIPESDVAAHRETRWLAQLLLIRSRMWRDRGEPSRALADSGAAGRYDRQLHALEHAANLRAHGRDRESELLLERRRPNVRIACAPRIAGAAPKPAAVSRRRRAGELAAALGAVRTAASFCRRHDTRAALTLARADLRDCRVLGHRCSIETARVKALRSAGRRMRRRRPRSKTCDRILAAVSGGGSNVSAFDNDLGVGLYNQGRFEAASKRFREAACGGSATQAVRALSNRAAAQLSAGDSAAAARSLERARERAGGVGVRARINLELNAGMLELDRGYSEDALERFEAARQHLGSITDAAMRAEVLDRLGMGLELSGRPDEAERRYRQALEIRESFGEGHPLVATSVANLATARWARGRRAEAARLFSRMLTLEERFLQRALAYGTSAQRRAAIARLDGTVDWLVTFDLAETSERTAQLAFAAIAGRQGRALDAAARARGQQIAGAPAAVRARLARLRRISERIVYLALQAPADLARRRARATELAALEKKAAALEAALGESVALLDRSRAPDPGKPRAAIAGRLGPGQALVTYVRYRRFDPKASAGRLSEPRYAAYVLLPGGAVRGVDLGEASRIDRLVGGWRAALATRDESEAALAAKLGAVIYQPVAKLTGGARDLYVVPDAALNLIPMAALRHGDRWLGQRVRTTYLTSPRDLVVAHRPLEGGEVVVFANPDFGKPRAKPRGGLLGAIEFAPLPGTATEAKKILEVLDGAELYDGPMATGEALVGLRRPAMVHVATHGFFVPPPEPGDDAQILSTPDALAGPDRSAVPALARSGLAMAGANKAVARSVVTGLELSTLDLAGTRLVTLSACDTGRGTVVPGDGVYGMRRALHLAGAEAQLVSLWQVDDRATARLMVAFYQHLEAGRSRGEALRRARAELRQSDEHRHPYFWSAFILAGDPGHLDGTPAPAPVDVTRSPAPPRSRHPTAPVKSRRGCGCQASPPLHGALPWAIAILWLALRRCRSA